ncbi:unnamed protein product [Paramecium octaurelia]|uniref:Uncharacterized protein n=1 Tax=Paramecium octaurelia TaxID=43137 RepID=A0A8S1YI58_PAROT|nr:unnamed protein product [Paramecium octaurelia]
MQEQQENNFSYEIISIYHQGQFSNALAINRSNTLLLVGSKKKFKIFQFKHKYLKQIQQINKHFDNVTTLNFFQIKQWLISGSRDNNIIIWSSNLVINSKYVIKLKSHSDWINCLVLHPLSEDLAISGSKDSTIKFWCISLSSCVQTIKLFNQQIYSLSINNIGNKLISCSDNNSILILKALSFDQWIITQRIVVSNFGYRLSFVKNEIFVFQPYRQSNLEIYQLNYENEKFFKITEAEIQGGDQPCNYYFPMVYVSSKNCLLIKQGYKLNIIKIVFSTKEEIEEYKLQQVIDFKKVLWSQIFGTMSQDGQFLITWDFKSHLFQIREYAHKP